MAMAIGRLKVDPVGEVWSDPTKTGAPRKSIRDTFMFQPYKLDAVSRGSQVIVILVTSKPG